MFNLPLDSEVLRIKIRRILGGNFSSFMVNLIYS